MTHRYVPLVLLAVISTVPPLLACARGPETAQGTIAPPPVPDPTPTQTPTPTPTQSPTPTPTPLPNTNPRADGAKCAAAAEGVNRYLADNRACSSAADCASVRTECGTQGACGVYVTRGKEAGAQKLSAELGALECFAGGLLPCPSCHPLGPPACVGGACAPTQ